MIGTTLSPCFDPAEDRLLIEGWRSEPSLIDVDADNTFSDDIAEVRVERFALHLLHECIAAPLAAFGSSSEVRHRDQDRYREDAGAGVHGYCS